MPDDNDYRQFKVRLDPDTHHRLRQMAVDLDTSMNGIVQDAILDVLDEHENQERTPR